MASANRIRANRENAKKSTGPRTVEGKERSRANSLKQGMTGAGVVLNRDIDEAFQQRLAELTEEIEPQGILERVFVRRMALASVRLEMTERAGQARLARRRRRACASMTDRLVKELDAACELFEREAKAGIRALRRLMFGCNTLKARWLDLEAQLREQGYWEADQLEQVHRLYGIEPDETPRYNSRAMMLRLQNAFACAAVETSPLAERLEQFGLFEPEHVREILSAIDPAEIPTPAQAQANLLAAVAEQITELARAADKIREEKMEPERELALEAALFESSLVGVRSARYETMNDLILHRNWTALTKTRKLDPVLFPSMSAPRLREEDGSVPPEPAQPTLRLADPFWEPAESLAEEGDEFQANDLPTAAPCESFWEPAEALDDASEPPVPDPEPVVTEAQNEPNEEHSSACETDSSVSSSEAYEPAQPAFDIASALLEPLPHARTGCAEPASCS